MLDFSSRRISVEAPEQGSGNNTQTSVDWKAFEEKQVELLCGYGNHIMIGVITNIYDLGTGIPEERSVLWDDKTKAEQGWRLEKYGDGNPKDATAEVRMGKWKGVEQELLYYTPRPAKQVALAIDLPEVMFPYGEFFEGAEAKPYRVYLGKEGYKTQGRVDAAGTYNILAKPFNLSHTNINRGKDGVAPVYALAKNHKLVEIADCAGVLGEDKIFRAEDIFKLIGHPVMVEVKVSKQEWKDKATGELRCKSVIDAEVKSKLGPRDLPFYTSELKPKLSADLFSFILFDDHNEEPALKQLNKTVFNTMLISPDFEGSKLKNQLDKLGKDGNSGSAKVSVSGSKGGNEQTPVQKDKPAERAPEKVVTPQEPEGEEFDMDDEIPF